jgi:hypothetical protein
LSQTPCGVRGLGQPCPIALVAKGLTRTDRRSYKSLSDKANGRASMLLLVAKGVTATKVRSCKSLSDKAFGRECPIVSHIADGGLESTALTDMTLRILVLPQHPLGFLGQRPGQPPVHHQATHVVQVAGCGVPPHREPKPSFQRRLGKLASLTTRRPRSGSKVALGFCPSVDETPSLSGASTVRIRHPAGLPARAVPYA